MASGREELEERLSRFCVWRWGREELEESKLWKGLTEEDRDALMEGRNVRNENSVEWWLGFCGTVWRMARGDLKREKWTVWIRSVDDLMLSLALRTETREKIWVGAKEELPWCHRFGRTRIMAGWSELKARRTCSYGGHNPDRSSRERQVRGKCLLPGQERGGHVWGSGCAGGHGMRFPLYGRRFEGDAPILWPIMEGRAMQGGL